MTGSQSQAVVIRSNVPECTHYSEYREYLRFDFWYSCAYCSLTEVEAQAIGFEIDHFKPQAISDADGDVYSNLMWSCRICNRCKSNVWPSAEQRQAVFRFIKADEEDPASHYELAALRLIAQTRPGEWTLEVLNLNRKLLRDLRRFRERIYSSSEDIARGLRKLSALSPDSFKPSERQRFLHARDQVMRQGNDLRSEGLNAAIIRVLSHSPLLDPDPEVKSHARRRRDFLKRAKAIAVREAEVIED